MKRSIPLETLSVDVPDAALEAYEGALSNVCTTVGFFLDPKSGNWRVEGVKPIGSNEQELTAALALAAALSGTEAPVVRMPTPADGWLERTYAGFPEQQIGRRFVVRGTHVNGLSKPGRIILKLDAGLAFGSGEHGSTRGCLLALERIARRHPRRILDLGTGSGILAIAAARLLHRPVLATDIEPWSVRVARRNAALNHLRGRVRVGFTDGWRQRIVRSAGPYDLVFANILARPLCHMARHLAIYLAPEGTAVLSGLLDNQKRAVLAAHLRCGLRLEASVHDGPWTTLIVRRLTKTSSRETVLNPRSSCRGQYAM